MQITKETRLITSLAAKQNSIGPAMHNAGYQALGLNFIFLPVTTTDIKGGIAAVRGLNLPGTTVSMPHKQAVMQHIDRVDDVARTIGAVNTIGNRDGVLTGYNSDWIGAMNALKEATSLQGKRAVVLGAGGASRAIVYGLKQNGATVTILNRDAAKARKLAQDFGATAGGTLADLGRLDDYDVLVNATSIGFGTTETPVPGDAIKRGVVVLDAVFVPTTTTFLKSAQERGCKTVPGYRMLIHQALFQFELFTGQKPPFEVMEKALLAAVAAG
jgi:shikimate dehydrogenase